MTTLENLKNLSVVEYSAQRVLTTEQLAQAYECSITQIKQNFNNNISRFENGKHFFKLESEELKKLRVENFDLQISPMTRTMYLWTKRGASRHCKMLGTDKAWEMFDILEENYFDVKTNNSQLQFIFPKFFKNRQVVTIEDTATILNISRSFVESVIKEPTANINANEDYIHVTGADRAEFKRDNPTIAASVHHIIAILEKCIYHMMKNLEARH